MRHPRSFVVLLIAITLLLFLLLGVLLLRSGERSTPLESPGIGLYESAFTPSTSSPLETPSSVSQDNTDTQSSFGTDIDMEFPVLEE